jgi:uncharacterized cupin superfamily protein
MLEPVPEATLTRTPHGLTPSGEGWFIVNVAEARATRSPRFGAACRFEGERQFPQFGVNVRVLQPGQPNALYHRESPQEDFLVLSGECLVMVEDQERPMMAGDFLHLPPGTGHVFIGAGDGPCAILMVGARDPAEEILYPVSETAARHGASVELQTSEPAVAYAGTPPPEPTTIGQPW